MKNNIELLSPAGSFEALEAAVNGGCDAVYLGGQQFSARANANNFDNEELKRAIDFAHLNDVKLYYTANTIIKNKELNGLYKQVKMLYEEGIDAIILQDIGVYEMLKEHFPDLPLHGSTQMTIHSLEGTKYIEDLGFERVVLSRECSINEIKTISQQSNIDLEVFVHGALCYCYSGQCLMSSIIGGRSGNRGQCAQPCRLYYDTFKDNQKLNNVNEKYILSPKDVMSLSELPSILESGATSLKIEGRMKKPEYVALVTYLYRKYIDLYFEDKNKFKVEENDISNIMQIYNRGGFTTGYFTNNIDKKMMSLSKPNHFGIPVGKVESINNYKISIELNQPVNQGDYLEVTTSKGKKIAIHPKENMKDVCSFIVKEQGIKVNDKVYRLVDKLLNAEIQKSVIQKENKTSADCTFIGFIGTEAIIQLSYEDYYVEFKGNIVQEAKNKALSKEKIIEQLNKTGNEPIKFNAIEVYGDENIFMPISELNRLRREAIQLLKTKIISKYKREFNGKEFKLEKERIISMDSSINVLIRTMEHYNLIKKYPIDTVYIEMNQFNTEEINNIIYDTTELSINVYLALPRIIDQKNMTQIKSKIELLKGYKGFLIRTYDQHALIRGYDKNVIIDYTLNVFNNKAIAYWKAEGASKITLSNELNKGELGAMNHITSELMVYGYLPVMVSKQCIFKNMNIPCYKGENHLVIKDRQNENFIVERDCSLCVNTIFNTKPTLLIDKIEELKKFGINTFRIELLNESRDKIINIMENSLKVVNSEIIDEGFIQQFKDGFTRGHYNRGVK